VKIELGVRQGMEGITVSPEDPHVMAYPDYAEVKDGEHIVIQIIPGMF